MKGTRHTKLEKGELKSKLSFLVLHHNPEIRITEAQWIDAYCYYSGYSDCFAEIVNYPIASQDAQDFIINESFKYLLALLKK